jgi:hypothetical protein
LKKRHQKVVSATYGSSNEQIYLTKDIIMENLRAKFMKWRRRTSTHKYTRLEEFPDQLFDVEQTILKNEEETVKFITYASQSCSKFNTSNNSGNTAIDYGECSGLMKIIKILD